ncbi:hypothetical protein CEE45_15680 [Candidatus Heimdallarchaeota archaeon B3_Heim]|nr:MAG: hypothetical protein CEE45_15680 [Candidatus Heimdallarchaeota archaeon B3_Heim]
MIRNLKVQRLALFFFIVIILIVNGSILQAKSTPHDNNYYPFQLYMVASPEAAYQNDHFNMSLAITNIHFEEILNVSLQFEVHEDLEFIKSSELDLEAENDSSEMDYTVGTLEVDEIYLIRLEFNVTSSDTKTITVEGITVNFQLLNGLSSFVISNSVNILLKGEQVTSQSNTLPPLPSDLTPPDDSLIFFAYILPIVMFGISVFILRRIRR